MSNAIALAPSVALSRRIVAVRALAAGTAWGLTLGIGLTAAGYMSCGIICIPDALLTTAISVVAGIATMGPLVALTRKA